MTQQATLSVEGTGLITGLPVSAIVRPLPPGSGIRFELGDTVIPADPRYVVHADRGVTLGAEGKTLSIVEHFLSACAMTGHTDLAVTVNGAPELPILDGSAQPWVDFLTTQLNAVPPSQNLPVWRLEQPVDYQDPQRPQIHLTALPSDTLQITYLVDFNHPDLTRRWLTWRESDDTPLTQAIAPARTFGHLSELPVLQAQGLARGVTLENTLGLTDEGGYTTPLRMPDEPIRHKILDFIGDLMLCGLPIRQIKAHFIVQSAGHASHLQFGQLLRQHGDWASSV